MKKLITTTILSALLFVTSASADTLEVAQITKTATSTKVKFVRSYEGRELMNFTNTYKGSLSVQDAVYKGSYISDANITVTSKLEKVAAVTGKVGEFAGLRYDAYRAKGLSGYMVELARQLALEL